MMRTRVVFLSVSLVVVILFTGMVVASRETKEDLFKALGNLAEVVHLVRTEYVDELNTEALEMSLDAGIVESVDRWAAVLPSDQVATRVNKTHDSRPHAFAFMRFLLGAHCCVAAIADVGKCSVKMKHNWFIAVCGS